MCDTLCLVLADRTLFAKNSDRLPTEVQLIEPFAPRPGGDTVTTQYLTLPDPGATAVLGSRPSWLWGFEHGVSDRRLAVGNERVWTHRDPAASPPALIGMDLVRLALERAGSAEEAVTVVGSLLEAHGQGGPATEPGGEPYHSSFLLADPTGAWIMETSDRAWVARPVTGAGAISNCLSIEADWTRSGGGVAAGVDPRHDWPDPAVPIGHAERRLTDSRRALAGLDPTTPSAADLVAALRQHDDGPWGAPGTDPGVVSPLPTAPPDFDGTGISVCMHVRGFQRTTAAMVVDLPRDPAEPVRAWATLGSPCTGVFVPLRPPATVPAFLADTTTWERFAALAARAEDDPGALAAVRATLGPLEGDLWAEADGLGDDEGSWSVFHADAGRRLEVALRALGV